MPKTIVASETFPHEARIGSVSLEYPDEFAVFDEGSARPGENALPDRPEGVSVEGSIFLYNDDMTTAFQVTAFSDPEGKGLEGVRQMIADVPAKFERYKETNPDYYEGMKDIERGEPQSATVNGIDALIYSERFNGFETVSYYLECEGALVGGATGMFLESDYNANKEYYDSILASLSVA